MGIWIWHSWMVSGIHSVLSHPAGSTAAEGKHWEQTLCLPIVTSSKPNIGGGKAKNLFSDQTCVVGNRRSEITEKQWGL